MSAKNSIDIPCHHCGAVLIRPVWRFKNTKLHFCNRKCRGAWLKTQTGPNAYAYKGTNVQVNCSQCGKEVIRDPSHVKRNEHFFCGQNCWNKWRSVHMRDEGNPNFSTPAIETSCAFCGKAIRRKPWRIGTVKRTRHFCCKEHRAAWHKEHFVGENSPTWKGGSIRYYGPNWNEQKRAARKRDGYKCKACGVSQKKNGKALDVHHIVPFRSFGYVPGENENYLDANVLTNLVALCRNCHMKAEAGHIPVQMNLL